MRFNGASIYIEGGSYCLVIHIYMLRQCVSRVLRKCDGCVYHLYFKHTPVIIALQSVGGCRTNVVTQILLSWCLCLVLTWQRVP